MKELVLKWALKNAVEHGGKAQPNSVVPKVIGEKPELKKDAKEIFKLSNEIVSEINKLSINEQTKKLEKIAPELLEEKNVEKQELPELDNAEIGKVVTIFPPEPSKYATIGHAKACFLNYYYAKKYDGKFYIRFEDTNPNKVEEKYYKQMLEDLKWVGIEWNDIHYISDYVKEIQNSAEELIKKDSAYMCNCSLEKVKKNRWEKISCDCRKRKIEENLELWNKFLDNEFKEGKYALRAKIDMNHKNAAMRDPAIMRKIVGNHPRVGEKYFIWPTYDFATAYMDKIQNITHRIRSKEFEMHAEVQEWIQKQLEIKTPIVLEFARFNLKGIPASGRVIREMIEKEELMGWDDPRIPTLISLRKRGFQPEAIQKFLKKTGISKSESTIPFEVLESENREIIEPIAERYFFVKNKIKLTVRNIPEKFSTERSKHPDYEEKGKIKYEVNNPEETFYVSKGDFLNAKQGDTIRLMDLLNFKVDVITDSEIIGEFEGKEYKQGLKLIHWVFKKENLPVHVLMTDGSVSVGLGEKSLEKLKERDIIQFFRFGYSILDKKDKILKFRYTHK